MKRAKGVQFPAKQARLPGRASFSHRDMRAITRIKTILAGRGRKSRRPLTRRERRILNAHHYMVRSIARALFGGAP